ncbi:hypothetical protein AB1Y20_000324 [Prymnesium parvum]|uniref:Uncharacterized protein n=1 Tax=Prymnesium parvum TaxID=97485 RepID=A0AB34K7L2_PRYPA
MAGGGEDLLLQLATVTAETSTEVRRGLEARIGMPIDQFMEQTAPPRLHGLLRRRLQQHAPNPLSPLKAAETAAELARGTAEEVLRLLTEVAAPQSLHSVCVCYKRQHDAPLNVRLKKLLSKEEFPLVQAMVQQAMALTKKTAPFRSNARASKQARMLYKAGKGLFCWTDEGTFVEVIGFADVEHAEALRYEYAMRYGQTLASAVRDEIRRDLGDLLVAFLDPPPSARLGGPPDLKLASEQARELFEAAAGMGTHSAPFVRIFSESSASQLDAMMQSFEIKFNKTLPQLLRGEFYFAFNTRQLLLTRCNWVAAAAKRRVAAGEAEGVGSQAAQKEVSVSLGSPGDSFVSSSTSHRALTSPIRSPQGVLFVSVPAPDSTPKMANYYGSPPPAIPKPRTAVCAVVHTPDASPATSARARPHDGESASSPQCSARSCLESRIPVWSGNASRSRSPVASRSPSPASYSPPASRPPASRSPPGSARALEPAAASPPMSRLPTVTVSLAAARAAKDEVEKSASAESYIPHVTLHLDLPLRLPRRHQPLPVAEAGRLSTRQLVPRAEGGSDGLASASTHWTGLRGACHAVASSKQSVKSMAPKLITARDLKRQKQVQAVQKQLGSSSSALSRAQRMIDQLEAQKLEAQALDERCRSNLSQARIASSVKARLDSAIRVARETDEDLSELLGVLRLRVSEHWSAHEELECRADTEPSEGIQKLAADLREKMGEARRVLREGELASTRFKSHLAAAMIAVSQAIADERNERAQGGAKGGANYRKPSPR